MEEIVNLWSVRLISGEQIITELLDGEMDRYVMYNPLIVGMSTNSLGEELTTARPYDPFTDSETFPIMEDRVLSEPQLVSEVYRRFYVKALMFNYVKKARLELTMTEDEGLLTPEEFDEKIDVIETYLSDMADKLELKFDVELNNEEQDDDESEDEEEITDEHIEQHIDSTKSTNKKVIH